jgi:palmitoyltransferase
MASAIAPHTGALTGVETPFSLDEPDWTNQRPNIQSIEERSFNAALIVLELHFEREATYMAKSMVEVKKMIARTLDASLNKADVRERLAKNVDIWMHLHHIFASAIPTLENRSFRQDSGGSTGEVAESVELMLTNYEVLKEDLLFLNNLLVISRNMLAIKETAQEICRAVEFDQRVKDLIVLCVNVTRQGYDGEVVDEGRRLKLGEIVELCEFDLSLTWRNTDLSR